MRIEFLLRSVLKAERTIFMSIQKLNKESKGNEDTNMIVLLKTGIFVPLFFVSSFLKMRKGHIDDI